MVSEHPASKPETDTPIVSKVGMVRPTGRVFDRAPMLIYWETTLACGLSCRHCRATAQPDRSPAELSTDEALALMDRMLGFGRPSPHIVFTGGDPLRREDLEILVQGATERGIGASLAPAVGPDLTRERLASLKEAGVQAMSLSLDGSDAARHDGLRQVPGTFDRTMAAFEDAEALGIPVQVNTLVTDQTLDDLPAVYDLLLTKTLMRWSLFFLISVGRGTALQEITPGQSERLFRWLFERTQEAPFQIKTTEAMHYRRVAARLMEQQGLSQEAIEHSALGRGFGIRDGNGILFISHNGDIYPSGFLPVAVANVRDEDIVDIYRDNPTFLALRNPDGFKGRCGVCEFNDLCGGSRARAYAWTGDILESDPLCPYHPRAEHQSRRPPS